MSSTDPFGTRPFNRNDQLKASQLESMRQGNQGNVQIRNPDNYVRRLPGGHILTEKRRRSEGGSALVYIEITASTNISTYTGTIFDNPIDRTSVEVGVTVRSLLQSDGTIPDSAAGQGLWCILVDEVYYVVNPSVAYGA